MATLDAVIVRYRTHQADAETNARLVEAVFAQLRAEQPEGVRYATFRLGEGTEFVHVALFDDASNNPLASLSAFQEFQRLLGDRCEVAPVAGRGALVDSFGFLFS